METLNDLFQSLIEVLFVSSENPVTDYVFSGSLIVCLLVLFLALFLLIIQIIKGFYDIIDTMGVPLKKGCGEIIDKSIIKGFEMYTRMGPITSSDQFILQVEMESQLAEISVSEEYFQASEKKQRVETSYFLGRLSKNIFLKEIKKL